MKTSGMKSIHTGKSSIFMGYSWKAFGLGIRIDTYGVSIDFLWFWIGWER